jgi:maltose alpha-D-glucosyltransferase/alpha-amylase
MAKKVKSFKREPLWYKDAIIYELHIKAFKDSNADGIGDFQGLLEKLDYIEDLGVNTIWLLPFYPSPLRDDGYDIADYYNINPMYGDLPTFRSFLKEAHRRNLKVIIELVINHTSDQHDWFQRARRAPKGSVLRDYYVWSDDPQKFKDTRIIFPDYEASNWTWDPVAKQYYWHRFFHHQPDLNYNNPRVQKEILKIIDYWLEIGVDGFRLDAIPYLFEEEGTNCENLPQTHAFIKKMRAHIDANFENVCLLAEANMWPEESAEYFGDGDECHMNYYFPVMPRMFMAVNMENRYPITDIVEQIPDIPENCQWATFLRNHDELTLEMVTEEERDYMYKVFTKDPVARINLGIRKRLSPLLENDRRKIELLNVLLFSLPGTPVIYYGDEIGMGDNFYLGDRDGVRTPLQWDAGRNAGFSEANPHKLYLPLVIDPEYNYQKVNVESQLENSNSLLWWMRRIIKMRKRFKAFGRGTVKFLESENTKALAFVREFGDEQILVVANLSRYAQAMQVEMPGYNDLVPVEVFSQNSFPTIGADPYVLTLAPYGYYWFRLVAEQHEKTDILPANDTSAISLRKWSEIEETTNREVLEQKVLPHYLNNRMWFNRLERKIESIRLYDILPISSRKFDFEGVAIIVQINFFEGLYEKYRLAVSFAHGPEKQELIENHPESVLAHIHFDGRPGILFDASYSERYRKTLLNMFRKGQRIVTESAMVNFDLAPALKAMLEDDRLFSDHKLIESRNRHVVIQYGKKFIIKLYRKIDRGTDRDVELTRFLSEQKGFGQVPKYLGSIEYTKTDDIKRTLAIVQEFVPNHGDAWNYMSDSLNRFYERVGAAGRKVDLPQLRGSLLKPLRFAEMDQRTQELIGGAYIEHIRLLAQRTAEMHLALASEQEHKDFISEPFSLHYQRSLFATWKTMLRNDSDKLHRSIGEFQEKHQKEIKAFLGEKGKLLDFLKQIYNHKLELVKIRPHGDYILSSLLFKDNDFVITNFEGDSSFSLTERRLRKAALVDVASMLCSFHFVAYSALFQNVPSGHIAEHWFHNVSQIFMVNYMDHVKGASFLPSGEDFDLLLETLLIERYLYEAEMELRKENKEKAIVAVRGIMKILKSKK